MVFIQQLRRRHPSANPRTGGAQRLGKGTGGAQRLGAGVLEMGREKVMSSSPFTRPWGVGGATMAIQAREPHHLWAASGS